VAGGDAGEGGRRLRAACRVDPGFIEAPLGLARALAARGGRAEARAEARRAVVEAERAHDPTKATEARELLASFSEERASPPTPRRDGTCRNAPAACVAPCSPRACR